MDDFYQEIKEKRQALIKDHYTRFATLLASGLSGGELSKAQTDSMKIYREEMESFLDREYGKPLQRQQHSGDKENPIAYTLDVTNATEDQLQRLIATGGAGAS